MTFAKAIETLVAARNGTLDVQILARDFLLAYNLYGILNAIRDDYRFVYLMSQPSPACLRAVLSNPKFENGKYVTKASSLSHEEAHHIVFGECSRKSILRGEAPYKLWNEDENFTRGTLTIPSRDFVEIAACIPEWKIAEVDECLEWFGKKDMYGRVPPVFNACFEIPVKYFNEDNTLPKVKAHAQLLDFPSSLLCSYGNQFCYLDSSMSCMNTFEGFMFRACLMENSFGYALYYES